MHARRLPSNVEHWITIALPRRSDRAAVRRVGVVLENSDHWIYEEHPEKLTQILLDFFS
jgi:pimeloyl-ACP methyl ester carboxylesterase